MLGTVLQQAIRNSMWVYTKDIKATKSDISISLEQTNLEIIFSSSLERLLKCRSFKYIMKSLLCTHAFNNNFQKNLNLKQIYFTVTVIMTTLFSHTQTHCSHPLGLIDRPFPVEAPSKVWNRILRDELGTTKGCLSLHWLPSHRVRDSVSSWKWHQLQARGWS